MLGASGLEPVSPFRATCGHSLGKGQTVLRSGICFLACVKVRDLLSCFKYNQAAYVSPKRTPREAWEGRGQSDGKKEKVLVMECILGLVVDGPCQGQMKEGMGCRKSRQHHNSAARVTAAWADPPLPALLGLLSPKPPALPAGREIL